MIAGLLKRKHPQLVQRMKVEQKDGNIRIAIPFPNPRYTLWIVEERQNDYAVGINDLHNHFDVETPDDNRKAAMEYIDEILNGEVVAIGLKNREQNYLLATMDQETALKRYGTQDKTTEIVSFRSKL